MTVRDDSLWCNICRAHDEDECDCGPIIYRSEDGDQHIVTQDEALHIQSHIFEVAPR